MLLLCLGLFALIVATLLVDVAAAVVVIVVGVVVDVADVIAIVFALLVVDQADTGAAESVPALLCDVPAGTPSRRRASSGNCAD